jgi:hypothetical protein
MFRSTLYAMLAGMAASIVPSLLSRFAMALIVIKFGAEPAYGVGTVGIAVIGAGAGAFMGVVYAHLRGYLPGNPLVRGLTFAVLLLLAPGLPFLMGAAEGSPIETADAAIIGAFSSIPFMYALILEWLLTLFERRWGSHEPSGLALRVLTVGLGLFALFGMFLMLTVSVGSSFRPIVLTLMRLASTQSLPPWPLLAPGFLLVLILPSLFALMIYPAAKKLIPARLWFGGASVGASGAGMFFPIMVMAGGISSQIMLWMTIASIVLIGAIITISLMIVDRTIKLGMDGTLPRILQWGSLALILAGIATGVWSAAIMLTT